MWIVRSMGRGANHRDGTAKGRVAESPRPRHEVTEPRVFLLTYVSVLLYAQFPCCPSPWREQHVRAWLWRPTPFRCRVVVPVCPIFAGGLSRSSRITILPSSPFPSASSTPMRPACGKPKTNPLGCNRVQPHATPCDPMRPHATERSIFENEPTARRDPAVRSTYNRRDHAIRENEPNLARRDSLESPRLRRGSVRFHATACNALQPHATGCNRQVEIRKRTHRENGIADGRGR